MIDIALYIFLDINLTFFFSEEVDSSPRLQYMNASILSKVLSFLVSLHVLKPTILAVSWCVYFISKR